MKTIHKLPIMLGFITAAFFSGMLSGCNAVSGLGRDMTETSDMVYNGIRSHYSNPASRDRPNDGLTADQRSRLGW